MSVVNLTAPSVNIVGASAVLLTTNPEFSPNVSVQQGGHTLYAATVTAGGTAAFLLAVDAAAVPVSGASLNNVKLVQAVPASTTVSIVPQVFDTFENGVVLLFSSSAATFTPVTPVFLGGQAL